MRVVTSSLAAVDRVRCAQLAGQFEPFREDVDADNRRGPDDASRHDRRKAHGARPEDGNAFACLDGQRVHHGAGACLQAAAQRGQQLQRQVLFHLHEIAHRCERVGGKGGLAEEMPFHAASEIGIAAAGAPKSEVELVEIPAIGRAPAAACPAGAAGLVGKDDVIAAPEAFHILPGPLDDARALMAQDQRPLRCIVPLVDIADVGVADAACRDTHQDLVIPRTLHLEGLDRQGAAPVAQDGRLDRLGLFIVSCCLPHRHRSVPHP